MCVWGKGDMVLWVLDLYRENRLAHGQDFCGKEQAGFSSGSCGAAAPAHLLMC